MRGVSKIQFQGEIIFIVKDQFGCIHFYKKKSQAPANLEQFQAYIESLEKELGEKLIKSYIVDTENDKGKYIWGSDVWRTDLNEKFSPHHQKYITYLEEHRKEITFIGPYKAMRTKGLHLCCYGHEWRTQPIKVKRGETCPKCEHKIKESNGVKYITELLVKNKIEFIKEVHLTTFGHDQDLRLDFLVCQNNHPLFAIEYHGIQHYKQLRNAYFGGYKGYRKRKQRDRIKHNYCWKIGLPIIAIPYTETEEQIEETVFHFLNLFELAKPTNSSK